MYLSQCLIFVSNGFKHMITNRMENILLYFYRIFNLNVEAL